MDGDNFTYLGVASGLYRKPEDQQTKQEQPKQQQQTKQQQQPKQQQPKQQQQPKKQGGQKKGTPQKKEAENKENVDKNQEDVQIDPEEDVKESEVEVEEVIDASNAGLLELVPDAILSKIAHLGGTQATCELALTCKYLKKKLFSSFLWKSVKSREYNTTKPIIKVKLEVPIKDEEVDEEKTSSGLQAFPIAYFVTESRLNSLLEFWLDKLRDAQDKKQKKGDLNVSFGGGIYIESAPANQQRGRQNESSQKVLAPKDLSTVAEWLEGAQTLLQSTSASVTLPVDNGKATLSRFGRGGELLKLSFDNNNRNYYFSVSSFMLGLRQAGKDYLKLVGRCEVALPQWGKTLTLSKEDDKEEVEKFMEREKTIQAMLQHTKINLLLRNLKNNLRSGAVIGAKLDKFFAERKLDKKRLQAQKNLEYSSMHQFVLNNLPEDYEEIVKEAESQNLNAGEARSQKAADRKAKYEELQRQREQQAEEDKTKKLEQQQQQQNQQQQHANRNQPKEKKRIVTVQTVDDEGFITNVKTKVGKDKTAAVSAKEEEKKLVAKQAKQAKKLKKVETQVMGSREQVSHAVLAANFWSVEPTQEKEEEEAPQITNKAPAKQPAKKQQQQKQQAKTPAAQQKQQPQGKQQQGKQQQPQGKQQQPQKQQPTQKQQPQKQQPAQQQKQQPGKKQQGKKNQQNKQPLNKQDDNLIMGMPQNQVIAASAVVVSVIAFMYTFVIQGF